MHVVHPLYFTRKSLNFLKSNLWSNKFGISRLNDPLMLFSSKLILSMKRELKTNLRGKGSLKTPAEIRLVQHV